ncbi:MAG: hypothetical protein JNM81_00905, partial [Rhodospirillaceae bacterium]|nr:hypothetical protein [Rhodospirillaceae bacterium]
MRVRILAAVITISAVSAAPLTAKDLLIRNVTVFDGTGAPAIPNTDVLVKGNKIAAVSFARLKSSGATVIDGTGKFLIPGLIDSHIHLPGGQSGTVADGDR